MSHLKRALSAAKLDDYRRENDYEIDFDIKERGEYPKLLWDLKKQIFHYKRSVIWLARMRTWNCKTQGINFGQSEVPNYGMAADLAEFLITYYTPKNGLVLIKFSGRFTIGAAALFHGRRFVGYDLNPKNVDRANEVFSKHLCHDQSRFELHNSDGVTLKSLTVTPIILMR